METFLLFLALLCGIAVVVCAVADRVDRRLVDEDVDE